MYSQVSGQCSQAMYTFKGMTSSSLQSTQKPFAVTLYDRIE